ncbi:hypothetical protein FGO68_gene7807 [Halteria grandinella]|uniref:F-box domain-containing protein n=1 Tax=Halteria grandinella TaxID=5974 RepID=A0A8J8NSV3_HALGN|nr:hypothetical protein FGO68_gene7807 [Halteria grandinella]
MKFMNKILQNNEIIIKMLRLDGAKNRDERARMSARLNHNLFSLIFEYLTFKEIFRIRLVNKFHIFERAIPRSVKVILIGHPTIQIDYLDEDYTPGETMYKQKDLKTPSKLEKSLQHQRSSMFQQNGTQSLSQLKPISQKVSKLDFYYRGMVQYFLNKSHYIKQIVFVNITITSKWLNKGNLQPFILNQKQNLQCVTFERIKADNIFTVETLLSVLEKIDSLRRIELDSCCTRFTDKFFSHFGTKYDSFLQVKEVLLKKVVINQINMAAEVFFEKFMPNSLESINFDDCFKQPPVQPVNQGAQPRVSPFQQNSNTRYRNSRSPGQNRSRSPQQVQWESVYNTYVQQSQYYLNYTQETNIIAQLLQKQATSLQRLSLVNCAITQQFFSQKFLQTYQQQDTQLQYLDISFNTLSIDDINTFVRILCHTNQSTLKVLKLRKVSQFSYNSDDFTNSLIQALTPLSHTLTILDLSCNNLGDKSAKSLLTHLSTFRHLSYLSMQENWLTDRSLIILSQLHENNGGYGALRILDMSKNQFELAAILGQIEILKQLSEINVEKCYEGSSREVIATVKRQLIERYPGLKVSM